MWQSQADWGWFLGEDAEQGCARTASALPAGLCEGGVPIGGAARALPPGEPQTGQRTPLQAEHHHL